MFVLQRAVFCILQGYGYSGHNSFSSGYKPNVAMYAAGGVAAGAVMGAGAYYAYNQMQLGDSSKAQHSWILLYYTVKYSVHITYNTNEWSCCFCF